MDNISKCTHMYWLKIQIRRLLGWLTEEIIVFKRHGKKAGQIWFTTMRKKPFRSVAFKLSGNIGHLYILRRYRSFRFLKYIVWCKEYIDFLYSIIFQTSEILLGPLAVHKPEVQNKVSISFVPFHLLAFKLSLE